MPTRDSPEVGRKGLKTMNHEIVVALFPAFFSFGCVPFRSLLKGACGMGPWLVLVSPCFSMFRENVVATCKIGSFLCSLDNLLQKNVIVLFFENQISKWHSFEKKGYFRPTFHIF